ncbi:MAG: hypothetical protein ACR2JX_00665 [Mycobacteriales bacterium]
MPEFSRPGGALHLPGDGAPPKARVLLATSLFSTEELKSAALTLLEKGAGGFTPRKDRPLRILVLNDAQRIRDIARFGFFNSGVVDHAINSAAGRYSTRKTIREIFGRNVEIKKINLSSSTYEEASRAIDNADLVYGPGGTVGLTALGVERHKDLLRKMIYSGKPVMLESAFAIAAGENYPNLEPSDSNPQGVEQGPDGVLLKSFSSRKRVKQGSLGALEEIRGLGILPGDVVVHAAASQGKLPVPFRQVPFRKRPWTSVVTKGIAWALAKYETPVPVIARFKKDHPERTVLTVPTTGGHCSLEEG